MSGRLTIESFGFCAVYCLAMMEPRFVGLTGSLDETGEPVQDNGRWKGRAGR